MVQARAPRGHARPAAGTSNPSRDPDLMAPFLEDAAHFPGGHAYGVVVAASEADVAAALRSTGSILPIGAQSSLTGGATPMGETVLTTSRLNRIEGIGDDWVRVQAGVTLVDLDAALAAAGKYYPPVPTFMGAFVGGTVATNAAGAATFKYGTTRDWVRALTVVLPNGEVLDVERGATRASGEFEIVASDRTTRVPIPRYRMPDVPKCSAGYFASPDMDLIDLFIGSEGTLGVVTAVTLRVLPVRPAQCLAFVPLRNRRAALMLVRRLRDAAVKLATTTEDTEDTADKNKPSFPPCPPWWRASEIPVSAIEHMDARCLALLREDGIDRLQGVTIPDAAAMALLVTLELPPDIDAARAYD